MNPRPLHDRKPLPRHQIIRIETIETKKSGLETGLKPRPTKILPTQTKKPEIYMDSSTSFLQSPGSDDTVLCLHSSLNSCRQWNDLETLQGLSHRVVAPDLHNYGNGAKWSFLDQALSLNDEVEQLRPALDDLSGPIHLVGHSYGGAVAIKLAMELPGRFSSLTVYEPVLFNLLMLEPSTRCMASDVFRLIGRVQRAYRYGDTESAAQRFVDFWSGEGAWTQFSTRQQTKMASNIEAVLSNFEAILSEPDPRQQLRELDVPTLCLYGSRSPTVAVAISQLLGEMLPKITLAPQIDMGHMGPITHSQRVNRQISEFISSHANVETGADPSIAA